MATWQRGRELIRQHNRAHAVELPLFLEAVFVHPPQRQVDAVRSMGLALTADGYVRVDDLYRQTSIAGVYAAGDLTTPAQSATLAAAAGSITAAMCNHDLMAEQT